MYIGTSGTSRDRSASSRLQRLACGAAAAGVALAAWLALACAPASAMLTHEYLSSFNGSEEPGGPFQYLLLAAVDNSSGLSKGDVYVGEFNYGSGNSVNKFTGTGAYAGVHITGAETPQGSFGFFSFSTYRASRIAVDGAAGSPNKGDVYVADIEHGVIDRFDEAGHYLCQITGSAIASVSECDGVIGSDTPSGSIEPTGIAVDGSGDVYVADGAHSVIDEFSPSGAYVRRIADTHLNGPAAIALDSAGNLYVNNSPNAFDSLNVVKFDATGAFVSVLDGNTPTSVAVDPANDHVLVAEGEFTEQGQPLPDRYHIVEYDSSGTKIDVFGKGGEEIISLAVAGSSGEVYVGGFSSGLVEIYGPLVVVPDVTTRPASPVEETAATLNGEVSPDTADGGGPVTSCEFEYGTTAAYGQIAPCSPATPYSGTTSVSAKISGLTPRTEYHYRLAAANASGSSRSGDETFIAAGPPAIHNQFTSQAAPRSATLGAEIEPYGLDTTCKVQYVSDASFQVSGYAQAVSAPCERDLGSGYKDVLARAPFGGLSPDTKYHFRFVATNQAGTETGADETFTTFGLESFSFESVDSGGRPFTQAGGHPYAWDIRFAINALTDQKGNYLPDANMKTIRAELPVGFVGNATATPQCPAQAAERKDCEGSTQVGMLRLYTRGTSATDAPVFNMVPPPGVPAQLMANISNAVNVYIDVNVRTGGDYGIVSVTHNASTDEPVRAVWLRLWGVPADENHNRDRYCPAEFPPGSHSFDYVSGCSDSEAHKPFLINPSECTGQPQTARLAVDSWAEPGMFVEKTAETPATTGCEHMVFQPKLTVQPENPVADSPSGLWVDLKVPQNTAPEGLDSSTLKKAVVALPVGVSVSPSAADGLQACSPEEIGLDNAEPARCPDRAKIGTIEITTPLVPYPLTGTVFVAQQGNNPFGSLLAIYVVAHAHGALVKLAGHVELDPATGQLVTTFDNAPQVPFDDFKLYFFGGPRGPLAMPIKCGTYTSTSDMTPWSAPESGPDALPSDFFTISEGCSGGFAPKFVSGVTDPQAGAYSSFVLSFERSTGEQEPAGLTMSMPPGLLAAVGNVPLCSEADANAGTCPESSQIGTVEAGAGTGSNPLFLPGKLYLTGPYEGAPYGLAVVVPAIAGPFNLGNVVVRQSLRIDPNDAHVNVVSDPFPTIVKGVPLRLRRIDVSVNRPKFMINPTDCEAMSIDGTLPSTEGATATVSSRFQLTNCGALAFKPVLKINTTGHTSRANGASLNVRLTYPPDSVGKEANIKTVKVELPKQLPSRLNTLQQACPDSTFDRNPAACPANSRVGTATATTSLMPIALSGPAYFVSHGGAKFPELIVVLAGDNITVYLHGETFISKAGITSSTFHNLPDVPIGEFQLRLPQGRYSALAANGDLCASKLAMPTSYTAQNGLTLKAKTPIGVTGCARHKSRHPKHHKSRKSKHRHASKK